VNRLLKNHREFLDMNHQLRQNVLEAVSNSDLEHRLGGTTLSLRRLLLEQGEFQAAYTRSFRTCELRFDVAAPTDVDTLAQIQAWFAQLDGEMIEVLEALEDADLKRPVDRGGRYSPPVEICFHTYRETLLIFAAKASVYLRALGRELSPQISNWVA